MSGQPGKENTEPDNINVGLVGTITVVGALLVVAIAAALTALVRSESSTYGNEVGAFANLGAVRRLKDEQRTKLESPPTWSDREKGLVSVPIDRAMGLVTADIRKDPFLATPSMPKKEPDAGTAAPPAPTAEGSAAPPSSASPEPEKGVAPAPSAEAPKPGVEAPKQGAAPSGEAPKGEAPAAPGSGAPAQKE